MEQKIIAGRAAHRGGHYAAALTLYRPPDLSAIHLLIADYDRRLAEVTRRMLKSMGFSHVSRVHSGEAALERIARGDVDILITEWDMDGMDGIELVRYLRDQQRSPDILLPIIMLTGRAERGQVEHARDQGITEYVVKPFTSAMLFDRIRRVFDQPRDFVLSASYTGPDRRRRSALAEGTESQRVLKPMVVSSILAPSVDLSVPRRILPDDTLRRKAGLSGSLGRLITQDTLERAQAVIETFRSQSQDWIATELTALRQAVAALQQGQPEALPPAQRACLAIKARAGSFGYDMVSTIAFALYGFLYHDFRPQQLSHHLIVQKHLDVLSVLLSGPVLGYNPAIEEELTSELLKMTARLKDADLRRPLAGS